MLECRNNMKYAGDGKVIQVSVCQKLSTQNVVWQSYWENKKGEVFCPTG